MGLHNFRAYYFIRNGFCFNGTYAATGGRDSEWVSIAREFLWDTIALLLQSLDLSLSVRFLHALPFLHSSMIRFAT